MSPIADSVSHAAETFSGQLLLPDHPSYDDRRRVHNGLIDKRPALIASCHGTADIADAVRLAHTLGLDIAVRGGGHNVAGRAAIDHGLMIDLSPMRGIYVDPANQRVRAQGASSGKSSIGKRRSTASPRPAASSAAPASPA
jgi:FAD/FMN-containing dehydrogenase